MKKILILALCLVLAAVSVGCGKYISSYKAIGFVRSSTRTSAYMSFISFSGTMVFQMKSPGGAALHYTAALETVPPLSSRHRK